MEIRDCDREKLIERYNSLGEDDKRVLDGSYRVVIDTQASASRIEEIKEFCRKMGYRKIGISFCKGLRKYGEILDEIFGKEFEVYSVCCNVAGLKRDEIGVPKMTDNSDELACNPLGEVQCMNEAEVDFVIMVGFCLGHEQLFMNRINVPTTTLIVKDRKYGHNPKDSFVDIRIFKNNSNIPCLWN